MRPRRIRRSLGYKKRGSKLISKKKVYKDNKKSKVETNMKKKIVGISEKYTPLKMRSSKNLEKNPAESSTNKMGLKIGPISET